MGQGHVWPLPRDYLARGGQDPAGDPAAGRQVAKVFADYEELKSEAEQLDFDDLLLHICAVLEDDEDFAREFRAQYRWFVVDEYQDVTPLQQRLLDAWLGGRDQVTVVGDANQTIYSFAGASPRIPARLRPAVSARRGRPAGARLPVDAAGGQPGQPGDRRDAGGEPRGSGCG